MFSQLISTFTREAKGVARWPKPMDKAAIAFLSDMIFDELKELAEAEVLVEQVDALVDLIIYILDQAAVHGYNLDPILMAVHAANMKKRFPDGTFHKRVDGKVIKPEGWQAPDEEIEAALQLQKTHGSFSPKTSFIEHYYIACPYSHPDEGVRHGRYIESMAISARLNKQGLITYSPIASWHEVARRFDLHTDFTYWLETNYYFIRTAKAVIVLMLDDWQDSVGVTNEIAYANKLAIPVLYMNSEGEAWADPDMEEPMQLI